MRKQLTVQQVNYWKLNLSRILKIGVEFEFNLPDKTTGSCKGRSFTCPCMNYGKEEHTCWKVCLNEEACSKNPSIDRCANFNNKKCTESQCADCEDYKFQCIGPVCSNHMAACLTCKDFTLDCSSCIYRFDPNKNPDAIRQSCTKDFNPSGSYGVISPSGVHNVTTDGSLLGKKGMEVITTGRRVDYWEFYRMSKDIIDTSIGRGAYINERCSIHMHGLASYYGKLSGGTASGKVAELERSVPEIVLANLHQLIRRYQNAITWMTSGLDDPNHLTRWEKFRVSVMGISAIPRNMRQVRDEVINASGGNKYGWANYKFCEFDGIGAVKRLHVEVRVMDGLLSPSAVAACSCMYYALFIKAVELSRYGVMYVGNDDWKVQAEIVKSALMNNTSNWEDGNKYGRFSDTSKLHKYTDILVAESFELISQLKHILAKVGPAYDILEKLAESPCSIRRCEGTEWVDIEKQLEMQLTEEGKFEYEISKLIDTRGVGRVKSIQEWMVKIAETLQVNKDLELENESIEEITNKIAFHIEDKQSNGEMIWADKIGSMIAI